MNELFTNLSFGLFFWQLFLIATVALWIYCLIDILKNEFEQNDKIIWLLVVILLPVLGSILYLFIGKAKKVRLD